MLLGSDRAADDRASVLRDEGAGLLQALAAAAKEEELTQHVSYGNRSAPEYQKRRPEREMRPRWSGNPVVRG